MDDSKNLNLLLKQAGEYHPLYGGGLATHVPMVLIALSRLNASNEKLEKTFNESVNNLELIGSLEGVNAVENIKQHLGDSCKFKEYLKYFQHELSAYGTEAVVKKSLSVLISGIAASAFHALIRLAYAIEENNQGEIAIALAFWAIEYQSFELRTESTDESLECILLRLAPLGEDYKFSPGIIVDRMAEIGELLKSKACLIQPNSLSLSDLRQFVLKAFYAENNFTVLHTVTGCHAFSIITPYLVNVQHSLAELWKAIVVAYLSTGLHYKNIEITPLGGEVDFAPVIASALTSSDAHVIKLVYTCHCEYQQHNDPLYFNLAQRAVLADNKK